MDDPSRTVLIAGCGYIGTRLAELLLADGRQVQGVRRHWPEAVPAGLVRLTADLTDAQALAAWTPVRHVIFAAAAGTFSDEAYKRTYATALSNVLSFAQRCGPRLERMLFISSTGVYGMGTGDWVDERSPVATGGPFSTLRMIEAEQLVRASGLPAISVRFGGIYGPGRASLLDSVRAGAARLSGGEPAWTNRIHREDGARVLRFLLDVPAPAPLYVAVDDEPAPRDEILEWLAAKLGGPRPSLSAPAPESPQRGNRRCRNTLLKAAGYRFTYPTFREGFASMLGDS